MARSADETARILENLHEETFGGDFMEPYRLTWDQLRGIAGVPRLTDKYLSELQESLLNDCYALLCFNNSFIVAKDDDFNQVRSLSARWAEKCLATRGPGAEDDVEIAVDDDIEDD